MFINKLCLLLVTGGVLLRAQDPAGEKSKIERGRYLTEEVGKCQQCHSPRAETGEWDKERWLKGAVLNVAPIQPVEGWHKTSPDLTSTSRLWKRRGEDGMLKFLTTGRWQDNSTANPPMPAYRLTREDAEAVVAYLKSLK